jgi:methyl-accepting chemotaxis protein
MAGIDIDTILNAIPEDKKVKGLQKLGQILIQKGIELENQIPPSITSLVSQFTPGLCPDPAALQSIVEKRNNIVGKLNTVGQSLNTVTSTYTGVSSFLDVVLFSISNLKNIKIGVSAAAKAIPFGLPGAIPASLSDLGDAINRLTFDNLGNSKLKQQKDRIDSLIIPIAIFSKTIQNIINLLNSLDTVIIGCNPTSTLDSLSDTIVQTANSQTQADVNDGSYKGFSFQIEEVPFSPTVNRLKAIALNQGGIPLLETPLSFTTNRQTLIDELKLIIDRDDLKAF